MRLQFFQIARWEIVYEVLDRQPLDVPEGWRE
jgi:hypothetical protein